MNQRLWKAVLDGAREAVLTTDGAFRVRYLNAAAVRLLGVPREEARGRPLGALLPGEFDDEAPQVHGAWRIERVPGGWAAYGELPPEGGDGAAGEHWVQHAVEAQQLAAVGQLAAGVAHEIGAPLTAISAAVEYLLKGEAAQQPALHKDLAMILAQTQRITRLARSLVDLARPGEPVLVPIDLNAVVTEGYTLMEKQLRRGGVEGVLTLEAVLPPMRGDANQLQQVLINLVLNAQRAVLSPGARERRIEIGTRAAPDANELVVADHGPGIAEADLSRIFLPFFSRAGGTGLGLSLARNIVHRHGGTIRADSPVGHGATFTVRLPRVNDGDG